MHKAINNRVKSMDILSFFEMFGLQLEVKFRGRKNRRSDNSRFYVMAWHTNVIEDGYLQGKFGDGFTPEDALRDYASEIQGRQIVVGMNPGRDRVIEVPEVLTVPDDLVL